MKQEAKSIEILYEDDSCIVCVKPAGLPTQSAKIGQVDMVSELKNYRASKKEAIYLGVCHRLDQPVEGIMVFAKTKIAAASISQQIVEKMVEKHYYALILGEIDPKQGCLENYLRKDSKIHGSVVCNKEEPDGKKAKLSYKTRSTRELSKDIKASLVDIQLETGRLHQIRVQFAHRGNPIIGDRKYGVGVSALLGETLALCSYRLEFIHPLTKKQMKFQIRPKNKSFALFLQDIV
jgi:23S rRNA pseudouridine1911/1915/1917 synthase